MAMRRVLRQCAPSRVARATSSSARSSRGFLTSSAAASRTRILVASSRTHMPTQMHAAQRMAFSNAVATEPEDADEMSEVEYNSLADEMMDALELALDELEPLVEGFDLDNSQGVMTLELGEHGTWVINKQEPNRQIWWSSPFSGPKRFRYDQEQSEWVATRDGAVLRDLLTAEIKECVGHQLEL